MRTESLEFLKHLLTSTSPSGYEASAQKIWCDYMREFADEVYTDAYGNGVAVLNPTARPKIIIDGHIDEIGLMIKHIDEKGYIMQKTGKTSVRYLYDLGILHEKTLAVHAVNVTKNDIMPSLMPCLLVNCS